jgi:hypothetical protein
MNVNQNGGYYAAGVPYDMSKKMEVLQAYLDLMRELDPAGANTTKIHAEVVAAAAKVSIGYADKVIREYLVSGAIADPRLGKQDLADKRRQFTKIGPEESNVLLALRAEDDQQWLIHYQQKLYAATGWGWCTCGDVYNRRILQDSLQIQGLPTQSPARPARQVEASQHRGVSSISRDAGQTAQSLQISLHR